MKHFKLHLLLVLTALIFTVYYPAWGYLALLKGDHSTSDLLDIAVYTAEVSLAIGAFAIIITLITPPLSRFFLGYESKKPDEGSEVYFYVVLTLFLLCLGYVGTQLAQAPARDMEADLTYTCELLNENLEFSRKDGTQQEVDSICGTETADPAIPQPKKK